jgi:DNA-binding winged helix-turn-helix (wHTH) protein
VRYQFRDLEIDDDAFGIRRSGVSVNLEPRVLEVILYLMRHRDRMVPKDELLERVWKYHVGARSLVARCVCIARRVLNDPRAIRTIRGRGYQWVGVLECSRTNFAHVPVAAGGGGSQNSRHHRYPGTHSAMAKRFFALTTRRTGRWRHRRWHGRRSGMRYSLR